MNTFSANGESDNLKNQPSSDSFEEPLVTAKGINRYGNEFDGKRYADGTNSYRYDNRDGTHYEKYRDGSADFDTGHGFTKHYSPPPAGEPVGSEQYDGGEARDSSQGYPTGREDVQHPGPSNSSKDGAADGPN